MQAIQSTQIGIQQYMVPVMPTDKSQADKGIHIPLVDCIECDTVWRSEIATRCPRCARCVGTQFFLDKDKTSKLLAAVSLLDEDHIVCGSDYMMWEFSDILRKYISWYDKNCRIMIQSCYEALRKQPINSKIAFAIYFFEQEYLHAPEPELIYVVEDDEEYSWTPEDNW